MRRLTLLPLLILPLLAAAQEERPAWSLPIEEVPVVTRRTMKEIGVQLSLIHISEPTRP